MTRKNVGKNDLPIRIFSNLQIRGGLIPQRRFYDSNRSTTGHSTTRSSDLVRRGRGSVPRRGPATGMASTKTSLVGRNPGFSKPGRVLHPAFLDVAVGCVWHPVHNEIGDGRTSPLDGGLSVAFIINPFGLIGIGIKETSFNPKMNESGRVIQSTVFKVLKKCVMLPWSARFTHPRIIAVAGRSISAGIIDGYYNQYGGNMKKKGRPEKYGAVLEALEDNQLYTASMIARLAQEAGMIEGDRVAYTRLRVALNRRAELHGYPDIGDEMIGVKGQSQTPAWYGWRWKEKEARKQA